MRAPRFADYAIDLVASLLDPGGLHDAIRRGIPRFDHLMASVRATLGGKAQQRPCGWRPLLSGRWDWLDVRDCPAIQPAWGLGPERLRLHLGLMNKPALGTTNRPMFKTRPPGSDGLDAHRGAALRTTVPAHLARRKTIGGMHIRHCVNVRPLHRGVELNRARCSSAVSRRAKIVASLKSSGQ